MYDLFHLLAREKMKVDPVLTSKQLDAEANVTRIMQAICRVRCYWLTWSLS